MRTLLLAGTSLLALSASVATAAAAPKVPIGLQDHFVCSNGVDAKRLLIASRSTLLEVAERAGANALVDEQYVFF